MAIKAKPLEDGQQPGRTLSRWEETRITLSNALIITRREVRDSLRDWRILVPIIILTLVFPFLATFLAAQFQTFIENYGGTELIGERSIPFLLMVVGFFPISISLVIALETFVGEKERRSLEPLLSTPLTNTELYIGKTLAAMIPPLIASYGGMFVYLMSLLFGELAWRPPALLIVQIILLTTVQALVMVAGAVVVSSQTTSVRAANLLASFIIIPMALLVQGEAAIMFLAPDGGSINGITALWAIIVGMLLVAVLLLRVGNRIFNREELLASTVDSLNLRGTLRSIMTYFRAVDADATPANNLIDWYRRGMPFALGRIRTALGVTLLVFTVAFIMGAFVGTLPQWQLPIVDQSEGEVLGSTDTLGTFFGTNFQSPDTVRFIFVQNARVLLGTLILAVFSFGIFALVLPPITFAVLGYLFVQVLNAGFSPLTIIAGIAPHGIVEIPVIMITTAAALSLGAVVTRPPEGETVGRAWISTLGNTLKLIVGIVIPGLIIAAVLEAYLTPEIILLVLD